MQLWICSMQIWALHIGTEPKGGHQVFPKLHWLTFVFTHKTQMTFILENNKMWFDLWDIKVLSRHRNLSFKPETTHRRSRWSGSPRGSLTALQKIFRPNQWLRHFNPKFIYQITLAQRAILWNQYGLLFCVCLAKSYSAWIFSFTWGNTFLDHRKER